MRVHSREKEHSWWTSLSSNPRDCPYLYKIRITWVFVDVLGLPLVHLVSDLDPFFPVGGSLLLIDKGLKDLFPVLVGSLEVQLGQAHAVVDKLVLAPHVFVQELLLHPLDLAEAQPIGDEDNDGRVSDIGVPAAQDGLAVLEGPVLADVLQGQGQGICHWALGSPRGLKCFQLSYTKSTWYMKCRMSCSKLATGWVGLPVSNRWKMVLSFRSTFIFTSWCRVTSTLYFMISSIDKLLLIFDCGWDVV